MKKLLLLFVLFIGLSTCEKSEIDPCISAETIKKSVASTPESMFTIEPKYGLTFTMFTNGIHTDPIVWPMNLSESFEFPVSIPQVRTYGDYGNYDGFLSGQAIYVWLDGDTIPPEAQLVFKINDVPVAISRDTLEFNKGNLLYYGLPVFRPNNITITMDEGIPLIGFFHINVRDTDYTITSVEGIGLPHWDFPVTETNTQPFCCIADQELKVKVEGPKVYKSLRLYVNGEIYHEVGINGSGTYKINMPYVSGQDHRDAVLLYVWN